MFAIYKKEMRSYFTTPTGYIFMAVFLALSGFIFSLSTLLMESSDISMYCMIMMFVYIVILPLLTMKALSDEKRTRTEQLLLTAPVSLTNMIMAKFMASITMFIGTLLISSLNFYTLYKFAELNYKDEPTVNPAILFGNMLALFLIGMCFIAIGLFVSSLTENQFVAAIATIGILLFLLVIGFLNSLIDSYVIRTVISWVSIFNRYQNFTYGVFDVNATIYYLSISVVFIFLTIRIYEKRRWS